jgi:hypothetical protein
MEWPAIAARTASPVVMAVSVRTVTGQPSPPLDECAKQLGLQVTARIAYLTVVRRMSGRGRSTFPGRRSPDPDQSGWYSERAGETSASVEAFC